MALHCKATRGQQSISFIWRQKMMCQINLVFKWRSSSSSKDVCGCLFSSDTEHFVSDMISAELQWGLYMGTKTIKYMTEYDLYRSKKQNKNKDVTLNKMIVMVSSSKSSYVKHSQWSDNDGSLCRRTSLYLHSSTISLFSLKKKQKGGKKLIVWIKRNNSSPREASSGFFSPWHRVLKAWWARFTFSLTFWEGRIS